MSQDTEPTYHSTIPLGGHPGLATDSTRQLPTAPPAPPWWVNEPAEATQRFSALWPPTSSHGPATAILPQPATRTAPWGSTEAFRAPSPAERVGPGGPVPPLGGFGVPPTPPPATPRPQRGPTVAMVALLALIAIVVGLTAGITIDQAIQRHSDELADRALSDRVARNGASDPANPTDPNTVDPNTIDPGSGSSGQSGQPGTTEPSNPGVAPTAEEAQDIAGGITPALVNINTQLGYRAAAAAGTGMILTADGKVLTNNHVIDGSTKIQATVVGTGKVYEAKVLGTAPTLDVALIQLVGASNLPTVKIDRNKTVKIGDPIVAAGNAGGKGGDPSVVSGVVTDLGQTITASDENGANVETLHNLIETNAPIRPGDSGGPLIDSAGAVIGMNTAAAASNQFQTAESVGYAIPIGDALDIVRKIERGEESDIIHLGLPGIIGVQVIPQGGAALVNGVAVDSPAAAAGIQAGDTITSIDGSAVTTPDSLSALMVNRHPGDKVEVGWVTATGEQRSARVTLMEGPAN